MIESVFHVAGADCNDEVDAIKKALINIGVLSVTVNLIASTVTVKHNPDVSIKVIAQSIESTGVTIVDRLPLSFLDVNRHKIGLISLSGVTLALGLGLEWFETASAQVAIGLFGIATLCAGVLVFPKAYRSLRQKSLDMNVLMAVAVLGAFGIQEYSEAATVVFLFSVAELLEAFSIDRARKAIRDVLKLTPQVVSKKIGENFSSVPVLDVFPGDLVLVKSGGSVPLDGTVVSGSSWVNQAPVTGESMPVQKRVGESVYAGTINQNGNLVFKVTQGFRDTKIARMMKLIEEAQEQKAPSERFVDRFAKIYTPVVFVLAVLVSLVGPLFFDQSFNLWFYRSLVLLVIACPCALVLATPISVVSGLASLARIGVLVKGGVHLESLGKLKILALDKTGTLTEGKFKVQNFRSFSDQSENEIFQIAGALERVSSHPLAKAVVDFIDTRALPTKMVDNFRALPGLGAEGVIGSQLYFVGNHRFTHELGVCTEELERYLEEVENQGQSVIVCGISPSADQPGQVLGVFGLGDRIRPHAQLAVQELHRLGIQKVIVLSGDNQRSVDVIKKISGVDEAYGDLLPEEKVQKINELMNRYKEVGMVGDGINDSPALAQASIGISMGAAGSDAAIEVSDVALMRDDLSALPIAIKQGKRVLGVIQFNIAFALLTKLTFLILAVFGISNLWLAVAADMGASLFVTGNALRLIRRTS